MCFAGLVTDELGTSYSDRAIFCDRNCIRVNVDQMYVVQNCWIPPDSREEAITEKQLVSLPWAETSLVSVSAQQTSFWEFHELNALLVCLVFLPS